MPRRHGRRLTHAPTFAIRGLAAALVAVFVVVAPVLAEGHPASRGQHCAGAGWLTVPGAERQQAACLADLTTAGTTATGHTDPADWAGLQPPGTVNPSGVPGIQIDGYFPDTSTFNTNHGWNHDSQFVLRLPDRWNGGLVITGPPGIRAVRQRLHHLRLGAGQGLRLRRGCVSVIWPRCDGADWPTVTGHSRTVIARDGEG